MWLLDTATICEPTKLRPRPSVLDWLANQDDVSLFTSVLCVGEILRGVERLPPGAKRTALRRWLDADVTGWFGARILPVNQAVALIWGELTATSRSLPTVDALIAATAIAHDLTVVTPNVRDFDGLEIKVFNPW